VDIKKKEQKKNIVKMKVNMLFVFFFGCIFYDKSINNKKEFNIFICVKDYKFMWKLYFYYLMKR